MRKRQRRKRKHREAHETSQASYCPNSEFTGSFPPPPTTPPPDNARLPGTSMLPPRPSHAQLPVTSMLPPRTASTAGAAEHHSEQLPGTSMVHPAWFGSVEPGHTQPPSLVGFRPQDANNRGKLQYLDGEAQSARDLQMIRRRCYGKFGLSARYELEKAVEELCERKEGVWAHPAAVSTKKSVSRSQLRSLSLGLH